MEQHLHLIDTGLHLMRKHGYGATDLQEILKEAGVSKGSLYHHFTSKEEFAALLQQYVANPVDRNPQKRVCQYVLQLSRKLPSPLEFPIITEAWQ